jgi:ribose transport system permease protein
MSLRELRGRALMFLVLTVVIVAVFWSMAPSYISPRNVLAILRQMSANGIASIGLTFVIVLKRFDLSLAGVASFAAMTLGAILSATDNLFLALMGSICVGGLCGLLSGFLITRFKLPDVVTTIGVGSIATGMAFIYGVSIFSSHFFSSGILRINDSMLWISPLPVVILAMIAAVAYYLMHMSRYGQSFYAVGESPVTARLSGVQIGTYIAAGFAICGAAVGAAVILNVAAVGAASVNAGSRVLLPSYTTVYLGAALFGGATIPATLAGAFLMALLLNGFSILSMPYFYSDAIVSFILIMAIAVFRPEILNLIHEKLRLRARDKSLLER